MISTQFSKNPSNRQRMDDLLKKTDYPPRTFQARFIETHPVQALTILTPRNDDPTNFRDFFNDLDWETQCWKDFPLGRPYLSPDCKAFPRSGYTFTKDMVEIKHFITNTVDGLPNLKTNLDPKFAVLPRDFDSAWYRAEDETWPERHSELSALLLNCINRVELYRNDVQPKTIDTAEIARGFKFGVDEMRPTGFSDAFQFRTSKLMQRLEPGCGPGTTPIYSIDSIYRTVRFYAPLSYDGSVFWYMREHNMPFPICFPQRFENALAVTGGDGYVETALYHFLYVAMKYEANRVFLQMLHSPDTDEAIKTRIRWSAPDYVSKKIPVFYNVLTYNFQPFHSMFDQLVGRFLARYRPGFFPLFSGPLPRPFPQHEECLVFPFDGPVHILPSVGDYLDTCSYFIEQEMADSRMGPLVEKFVEISYTFYVSESLDGLRAHLRLAEEHPWPVSTPPAEDDGLFLSQMTEPAHEISCSDYLKLLRATSPPVEIIEETDDIIPSFSEIASAMELLSDDSVFSDDISAPEVLPMEPHHGHFEFMETLLSSPVLGAGSQKMSPLSEQIPDFLLDNIGETVSLDAPALIVDFLPGLPASLDAPALIVDFLPGLPASLDAPAPIADVLPGLSPSLDAPAQIADVLPELPASLDPIADVLPVLPASLDPIADVLPVLPPSLDAPALIADVLPGLPASLDAPAPIADVLPGLPASLDAPAPIADVLPGLPARERKVSLLFKKSVFLKNISRRPSVFAEEVPEMSSFVCNSPEAVSNKVVSVIEKPQEIFEFLLQPVFDNQPEDAEPLPTDIHMSGCLMIEEPRQDAELLPIDIRMPGYPMIDEPLEILEALPVPMIEEPLSDAELLPIDIRLPGCPMIEEPQEATDDLPVQIIEEPSEAADDLPMSVPFPQNYGKQPMEETNDNNDDDNMGLASKYQANDASNNRPDNQRRRTRQPLPGLPPAKDASGRFVKRSINDVNGDAGLDGLPAKVARKTPDESKPVACHAKLIAHRYPATNNVNNFRIEAFEKSGDSDQILKNIRSRVCYGLVGSEAALRNAVNIGLEIDAFIDLKKRVKNAAGKKPTTREMYAQLSEALQMPGFENPCPSWFYGRRALAKISDCLQLERYAYRFNIDQVIIMAPQLKKAKILGLDFD